MVAPLKSRASEIEGDRRCNCQDCDQGDATARTVISKERGTQIQRDCQHLFPIKTIHNTSEPSSKQEKSSGNECFAFSFIQDNKENEKGKIHAVLILYWQSIHTVSIDLINPGRYISVSAQFTEKSPFKSIPPITHCPW